MVFLAQLGDVLDKDKILGVSAELVYPHREVLQPLLWVYPRAGWAVEVWHLASVIQGAERAWRNWENYVHTDRSVSLKQAGHTVYLLEPASANANETFQCSVGN